MNAAGIQVPYCTGRNTPSYEIPAGACDCHHHIYDACGEKTAHGASLKY